MGKSAGSKAGGGGGGGGKNKSTGGGGNPGGWNTGGSGGLSGAELAKQQSEVMTTARQMAGHGGDGKPAVLNETLAENALKGGWDNIPIGQKLMDLPGRQIVKSGANEMTVNGKKVTPNDQQKSATLRSYAVTKVVKNAKYSM